MPECKTRKINIRLYRFLDSFSEMRKPNIYLLAGLAAGSYLSPALGQASDAYFDCALPSSQFTLQEGGDGMELFQGDRKLTHTVIGKITIREQEGLCTAKDGQEFPWNSHAYLYQVKTEVDGTAVHLTFFCEEGGSGIPANVSDCKMSTTKDRRLKPAYVEMAGADEKALGGDAETGLPADIRAVYASKKSSCGKDPKKEIRLTANNISGPGFACTVSKSKPAGTGLVAFEAACKVDGKNRKQGIVLDLGNFKDHFALSLPGRKNWIPLYPCEPVAGLK